MEGRTLEQLADERAEPKIAESLADLVVGLDELRPHPENPRRGNITAIAASLDRFGQVKPVLALEDGTLIAGHHVYYAARHLGWDRIAAIRTEMDEDHARAYLLADNRISELGTYDAEGLGRLLEEVMTYSGGLEGTGYRPEDLKRFMADLDNDATSGGGGPGDAKAISCPRCGAPVE